MLPPPLSVEQIEVLLVGQSCISDETLQQTHFDRLAPVIGNGQLVAAAFLDQNVVTARDSVHSPAIPLESSHMFLAPGTW